MICHGRLAREIETQGLQNFVLSKSEPISDEAICRAENTSGMKSPMLSRSFPQHTFTWHAITDIVQNHLVVSCWLSPRLNTIQGCVTTTALPSGLGAFWIFVWSWQSLCMPTYLRLRREKRRLIRRPLKQWPRHLFRAEKQGKHMETNNN